MERLIWGPDEGVMPPRKYLFGDRNFRFVLPVRDRNFQWGPELPVRDRNFRWLAEEGAVLRENELPVLPVQDRNFRWGSELPVKPDRNFL
jgi:hypothetical protein